MEGYTQSVFKKYDHHLPSKTQHAPHKHCEITYGAKQQLVPDKKTSPELDISGILRVQCIDGAFLYYGQAVDNKLLVTLREIGTQQEKATESTATSINQILEYVATYPNDGITYISSNIRLSSHSDATYINIPNSLSRSGSQILLF